MLRGGKLVPVKPESDQHPDEVGFSTTFESCLLAVPVADDDAGRFEATLLGVSSSGIPAEYPALPPVGRRVTLRFYAEGFVLQQLGRHAPLACPIAILPGTVIEAEEPRVGFGIENMLILRVTGLWPIWSVSLQLPSESCVEAFKERVAATSLHLSYWMRGEFAKKFVVDDSVAAGSSSTSVGSSSSRQAIRQEDPVSAPVLGSASGWSEGVVCGLYVLCCDIEDRQHGLVQSRLVREPRVRVLWLEVHGPSVGREKHGVELRLYNHHDSDAHLIKEIYWSIDKLKNQIEVANHVLITRMPGQPKGARCDYAAPPLEMLAFRSSVEAEAVYDLAYGAQCQDCKLLDDAKVRMQSWSAQQQQQQKKQQPGWEHEQQRQSAPCVSVSRAHAEADQKQLRCWRRVDRPIRRKHAPCRHIFPDSIQARSIQARTTQA